jgi:hypothetical protein
MSRVVDEVTDICHANICRAICRGDSKLPIIYYLNFTGRRTVPTGNRFHAFWPVAVLTNFDAHPLDNFPIRQSPLFRISFPVHCLDNHQAVATGA